jgi:16S rRNA (guanine966-N2)-methyltransferase
MKHRVREAIFNLLGNDVVGKHAIDLFAGTGAIGLEALSRGATSATFIERHVPTARIVRENVGRLDVADRCELFCTSAFLWEMRLSGQPSSGASDDASSQISDFRSENLPPDAPWVVFCSPPYDFFVERASEMLELIGRLLAVAPRESVLVVEADGRLDFDSVPTPASMGRTALAGIGLPLSPEETHPAGRRAPAGAWRVRSYPPAQVGVLRVAAADGDSS